MDTKQPDEVLSPARIIADKVIPGINSEWTLAAKRRDGSGPPYLRVGNRVFYRIADVRAWLESCRHRSTSEYSRAAR